MKSLWFTAAVTAFALGCGPSPGATAPEAPPASVAPTDESGEASSTSAPTPADPVPQAAIMGRTDTPGSTPPVLTTPKPPPPAPATAPMPTVGSPPLPPPPPSPRGGPDRDLDGILDAQDRCPDQPEDRDGFEDADGCPDPDNDRDGVQDVDDKCPNQPGKRLDGC